MRFRQILVLMPFLFLSCMDSTRPQIADIVEEWYGKTLSLPSNLKFVLYDKEVTSLLQNKWDYAVVSYTDSIGCTSCKLQLNRWKDLINVFDSLYSQKVTFIFVMHPFDRKELVQLLKEYQFDYPVCIDEDNLFDKRNHVPKNNMFQTFLLDKNSEILAIGNPVLNPKVKTLYQEIIQGGSLQDDSEDKQVMTTVSLEATVFSMGDFAWQEERQGTFRLKNTGEKPLVIQDVITSCGCLTVDYPQEPVMPGKEAVIGVTYKADNPGYFNKAATVYCNAENSPIKLRVSGNAE